MQQDQQKDYQSELEKNEQDVKPEEVAELQKGEIIKIHPPATCDIAEHYFEMRRHNDGMLVAECKRCKFGFPISANVEARNGHIFIGGELVV